MSKNNAPVVVFAFNRDKPLKFVLARLASAEAVLERDIIVYIDGARNKDDEKKINAVLDVVNNYKATSLRNIAIQKRESNLGCQHNISSAISEVLSRYGKIIVIEDDVLISRFFLRYMDEALALYEDNKKIWGINGHQCPYMRVPSSYQADVYLSPRNLCTGWATWRDRWDPVDFQIKDWPEFIKNPANIAKLESAGWDIRAMLEKHYIGRLNSWALPCTYYMVKNNLYVVEPKLSLTKNIGFGIESVHCNNVEMAWRHQKYYNFHPLLDACVKPDPRILRRFKYVYNDPRLLGRAYRKLIRMAKAMTPMHLHPIDQW